MSWDNPDEQSAESLPKNGVAQLRLPAYSVVSGDTYDSEWVVALVTHLVTATPPVAIWKLENIHGSQRLEMVLLDASVMVSRISAGHPSVDNMEAVNSDDLDTVIPEQPHSWKVAGSMRGVEEQWTDWYCEHCNLLLRTDGTAQPKHNICSERHKKGPLSGPPLEG